MSRSFLTAAAALGAAGVLLGAFGAHALRPRLTPELMGVWQTAVQYHFWHALALLGIGVMLLHQPGSRWLVAAGWVILAGTVVFSGSLYLLALTGSRGLGAVTPIGGAALIGGWILLAVAVWRSF